MCRLLLPLLLAVCLASSGVKADNLLKLEEIASNSRSLEAFLSSPDQVDQYFLALNRYLSANGTHKSHRVTRSLYDDLIQMLRELPPSIAKRLWKPRQMGTPFELELPAIITRFDREVGSDWKDYVSTKLAPSQEGGEVNTSHNAALILNRIHEKHEDIRKELNKQRLEKAKIRKQLRAHANQLLQEKSELMEVADWVAKQYFKQEEVKRALWSDDADVVLGAIETWETKRKKFVQNLLPGLRDTSFLISALRRQVPSLRSLLSNQELFPTSQITSGKLLFRPPSRPFHTFWKSADTNLTECICLSPARLLTAAVRDSQFHYVERVSPQGKHYFEGWTQLVPVRYSRRRKDRPVYGSIDFGSRILSRHTRIETKEGRQVLVPLVTLWTDKVLEILPENWKGLIASPHSQDNSDVHSTLNGSLALNYLYRAPLRIAASPFDIVDSSIKKALPALKERSTDAENYKRKGDQLTVITDATTPKFEREYYELPKLTVDSKLIDENIAALIDKVSAYSPAATELLSYLSEEQIKTHFDLLLNRLLRRDVSLLSKEIAILKPRLENIADWISARAETAIENKEYSTASSHIEILFELFGEDFDRHLKDIPVKVWTQDMRSILAPRAWIAWLYKNKHRIKATHFDRSEIFEELETTLYRDGPPARDATQKGHEKETQPTTLGHFIIENAARLDWAARYFTDFLIDALREEQHLSYTETSFGEALRHIKPNHNPARSTELRDELLQTARQFYQEHDRVGGTTLMLFANALFGIEAVESEPTFKEFESDFYETYFFAGLKKDSKVKHPHLDPLILRQRLHLAKNFRQREPLSESELFESATQHLVNHSGVLREIIDLSIHTEDYEIPFLFLHAAIDEIASDIKRHIYTIFDEWEKAGLNQKEILADPVVEDASRDFIVDSCEEDLS